MYDVDAKVLAPVNLPSGLAWVACRIVAWSSFPIENGSIRIYECATLDGKNVVHISGNLIKPYRWAT